MPTVTVTKVDTSKGGAPRVYFDNKHDWKDAYYVSKKIQAPELGATIDANTASSDYQGKTYWYLNGFKPVGNGAPVAAPKALGGWNIDAGDLSRFVSNIVASAIEKGLILTTEDVFSWVAVGYRAGEQMRTGKVQDFNDVIPTLPAGGLNGPIDENEPDF